MLRHVVLMASKTASLRSSSSAMAARCPKAVLDRSVPSSVSEILCRVALRRLVIIAAALTILAGAVACREPERPARSTAATTGNPPAPSSPTRLSVHGALEGDVVPDGPAICTGLDVALLGRIGASTVTFDIYAPFVNYRANQRINLPQPGVAAGVNLTTDQPPTHWSVRVTGGSAAVQLGPDKRSGEFEADLVSADTPVLLHASGTWGCTPTLR
jgi:hypothetical protein